MRPIFSPQEQELIAAKNAEEAAALGAEIDGLTAADIAFTPAGGLASTTVQAALEEAAGLAGGSGLTQPQVMARSLGC